MKKIIKMTIAIVLVVSMVFVTFGAQEYNLSNEIENVQLATQYDDVDVDKMDTVLFGSYPQNDETGKTKEPIEWIVLERDKINRKALLLSKYILDAKCYDDRCYDPRYNNTNLANYDFIKKDYKKVVGLDSSSSDNRTKRLHDLYLVLSGDYDSVKDNYIKYEFLSEDDIDNISVLLKDYNFDWDTCTLRKWLNNEFFNIAFDNNEKGLIKETDLNSENSNGKEKVFLLKFSEISNYFPRQENTFDDVLNQDRNYMRLTKATNYAKNIDNHNKNLFVYTKDSLLAKAMFAGTDYLQRMFGADTNADKCIGCSDYWVPTNDGYSKAFTVDCPYGSIMESDYSATNGVRPAIWISY